MSEHTMSAVVVALCLVLPSCSGDGDRGQSGGSAGSVQDSAVPDSNEAGDDAPEGPFECLEGNVARRKSDGSTGNCGFNRCTVEDGCGNTALGCQNEEDCISSTLEAGWTVDMEVNCINGICDTDPVMPDQ